MKTKKLEQFSIDINQGIVSVNNEVEDGIYEFAFTFKDGKFNLKTCQDRFYSSVPNNSNYNVRISADTDCINQSFQSAQ